MGRSLARDSYPNASFSWPSVKTKQTKQTIMKCVTIICVYVRNNRRTHTPLIYANYREVKIALTVSEVKANNKGFLTLAMRKIEIFATRLALDPKVQSLVHHVRMFESL